MMKAGCRSRKNEWLQGEEEMNDCGITGQRMAAGIEK
jgi:hypothetical protein